MRLITVAAATVAVLGASSCAGSVSRPTQPVSSVSAESTTVQATSSASETPTTDPAEDTTIPAEPMSSSPSNYVADNTEPTTTDTAAAETSVSPSSMTTLRGSESFDQSSAELTAQGLANFIYAYGLHYSNGLYHQPTAVSCYDASNASQSFICRIVVPEVPIYNIIVTVDSGSTVSFAFAGFA